VLAAELDNDGCVGSDLRRQLRKIAELLDQMFKQTTTEHIENGAEKS
jgi:hypothetical protein